MASDAPVVGAAQGLDFKYFHGSQKRVCVWEMLLVIGAFIQFQARSPQKLFAENIFVINFQLLAS
ncbi:MAG: hypothetical protein ACRC62_21125 [Microcoleus sp.]